MKTKILAVILGCLVVLCAQTAMAAPVTVTVVGQGPGPSRVVGINVPIWNGGVYAGVENLLIDGVAYRAFCIDLYHFSPNGTATYTVRPLGDSPSADPPGPMGADKAAYIKEMWAQYYAAAVTDASRAAGFQLALWSILQGTIAGGVVTPSWTWLTSDPSGNHYGADALITWTNTHQGALADVDGLNNNSLQAFAVEGVPDGGATVMLLGGALIALGALRRRFRP